jgi:hypothetical protein
VRKEHLWRMTKSTAEQFTYLMDLLELYPEDTDEYATIRDEIRSLPGHPANTQEDDFIRWEVTTVQH